MTDEDIVELVDLARTSPRRYDADVNSKRVSPTFPGTEAISRVSYSKETGTVEIWTGYNNGPLSGHGSYMHCQRKDGHWTVISVGRWVS